MKKALWILFLPILAFLISVPVGVADDPVDIGYAEIYWEMATATNVAAATTYYPSLVGFSARGRNALQVSYDISGGVTLTIEISSSLATMLTVAGAVGDREISVASLQDIEAGQILQIGPDQHRNVSAINLASGRVVIDAPLTTLVANGAAVVIDPLWIDITRSGYDAVNYRYNQPSYVDATGVIDFDWLNTMRVRLVSVTSDATNSVRYRVKYR